MEVWVMKPNTTNAVLGGIKIPRLPPAAMDPKLRPVVVPVLPHFGQSRFVHGRRGGYVVTTDGSKSGACADRGHGESASEMADPFVEGPEGLLGDAPLSRYDAHQYEERDHHQIRGVAHPPHGGRQGIQCGRHASRQPDAHESGDHQRQPHMHPREHEAEEEDRPYHSDRPQG